MLSVGRTTVDSDHGFYSQYGSLLTVDLCSAYSKTGCTEVGSVLAIIDTWSESCRSCACTLDLFVYEALTFQVVHHCRIESYVRLAPRTDYLIFFQLKSFMLNRCRDLEYPGRNTRCAVGEGVLS